MSATLEQKQEMLHLIKKLNQATIAYDKGNPVLSDKEWDDMYFRLIDLEKETEEFLPDSPTHRIFFETVSELKKVKHNHSMLSLNKTKDMKEIESFIKDHDWIAMAKMDGLTCSLHYINGILISAETRGNGIIGEDVTHNAMAIPSIPKIIQYKEDIVIDGEIICTYKDFKNFEEDYKNPRNFASGSIRLLDSKECSKRHLTFIAWDIINADHLLSLTDKLNFLSMLNFMIVPYFNNFTRTPDEAVALIQNNCKKVYPIDGIVFKYDDIKEYKAAGKTDHHFKGGLCLKFYDETYPTRLRYIAWTMGRTGVLTPVAIFDPVKIDGTEVSRANLHNVSVMKEILGDCAYVGEPLEIFKSNMIIPQIYSAGPKHDYGYVIANGGVSANDAPEHCPICGGDIIFKEENNIVRAYCDNPNCEGKFINRLDHFCGKKGLDIKGLSKKTLEKLIDWGWVESLIDIFNLYSHQIEWINKTGFGQASVYKILYAIDEAKKCSFDKYLCALGVPLIGKVASKALIDTFGNYKNFRKAIDERSEKLYQINGIGQIMIDTLINYDYTEADLIFNKYICEETANVSLKNDDSLNNKTFCITGKLTTFKNRDELKSFIESKGGKVTNTVTSKTSYLINNDIESVTAKNSTAQKLKIPIISEEEFLALVNKMKI